MNRTLVRVGYYALLCGAYAVIPAAAVHAGRLPSLADLPAEIPAALTVVLGWLLVFRTNTSYARWWEARTLWGTMTNTIRNLAIKCAVLPGSDATGLNVVRRALIRFPQMLRDHLRDGAALEDMDELPEEARRSSHPPTVLTQVMYRIVQEWKQNHLIDGTTQIILDEELRRLLEIVGGCERIRHTRLARSYRRFARQSVGLYLATLPWGLVSDFRWWTVPLTVILSYFMLGLETVAEHTEEPFGTDDDDLDLDGMCRNIEASVKLILKLDTVAHDG